MKEKRFEVIHEEKVSFLKRATILKDLQTGRQYLYVQDGYSGGLTPLLEKESRM